MPSSTGAQALLEPGEPSRIPRRAHAERLAWGRRFVRTGDVGQEGRLASLP
jgi:hypothetical protein